MRRGLMMRFLANALLVASAMMSVAARPARMSLLRMWCCFSACTPIEDRAQRATGYTVHRKTGAGQRVVSRRVRVWTRGRGSVGGRPESNSRVGPAGVVGLARKLCPRSLSMAVAALAAQNDIDARRAIQARIRGCG
jgi:hypothetical protein